MRLIDADALKKKVQVLSCDDMGGETWHVVEEKDIDEAPTIEPDRPKGEWICEGAMADYTNVLVYRCSICEEHFVGHEEDKKCRHFCPNCGADMREGDSDA